MHDLRDKIAEQVANTVADSVDNPHDVTRFTPSVKFGRRYLAIRGTDGTEYLVTIEVEVPT